VINPKETGNLEELRVGGRIPIKFFLSKYVGGFYSSGSKQ
jgi:hypothetical protein